MSQRTRLPQNHALWSEDQSNAYYTKTAGVTASVSVDVPPPVASMQVTKIVYDGSGVVDAARVARALGVITAFAPITMTFWACVAAGTLALQLSDNLGMITQCALTTTWQHFEVVYKPTSPTWNHQFLLYQATGSNVAATFYMTGVQVEQSDAAGDYAPTGATAVNATTAPARRRLPQNNVVQSETFATTWTKDFTTVTSDAVAAPSGAVTADKIVETVDNNYHRVYQVRSIGRNGDTFTHSIYLKAGERTQAEVSLSDNATGNAAVHVDLTTGALSTAILALGQWGNVNGGAVPEGNGWWRVWVTATRRAGTQTVAELYLSNGAAVSYVGDVTKGLYAWGSQLEQSDAPGDYTPTDAIAVNPTIAPQRRRQGQNLFVQSQTFNVTWGTSNASVAAASQVLPDGTTGGWELRDDGSTTVHQINQTPGSGSGRQVVSWFVVKPGTKTWLEIGTNNGAIGVWFNLIGSGVKGSQAGGIDYGIVALAYGWYLVWYTYVSNGGYVQLLPTPGDVAGPYAGTGAAALYLWRAGCEMSNVPGDYVQTLASAVNPTLAPTRKR